MKASALRDSHCVLHLAVEPATLAFAGEPFRVVCFAFMIAPGSGSVKIFHQHQLAAGLLVPHANTTLSPMCCRAAWSDTQTAVRSCGVL